MAPRKIVLMACGSYSPPTFMHMRMFEIAKDYINSTGVGVVIGGIVSPVHDAYGKKDLVEAHHRLEMSKAALKSSSWIKVSDWETRQTGWTRTRLTLNHHEETINKHFQHRSKETPPSWLPDDILNTNSLDEPDNLMEKLNGNVAGRDAYDGRDVTVKLLCGGDLLESFAVPGLWADDDIETIVGRHGLVVITRSGSDPGKFIHDSDILYKHRKNITLITNYITNEVSSTVIRRLMRRGESAKYLTDDGVIAYIMQHGLYGTKPYSEYNTNKNTDTSPDDVIMTSPDSHVYKNLLIRITDRPPITNDHIYVKKPRIFLNQLQTNSVSPAEELKPKIAYASPASTPNLPGKAVKITAEKVTVKTGDNVSITKYSGRSLDEYITNQEALGLRPKSENLVGNKKKVIYAIKSLSKEDVKKSRSEMEELCDKMNREAKLNNEPKTYKTRSCNDIVKLVLTKHGIHVISDTEAIV